MKRHFLSPQEAAIIILGSSMKLKRIATGLLAVACISAAAQAPAHRLTAAPSFNAPRTPLAGSTSGRLARAQQLGHLAGETELTGMALILRPTPAQDAALTQLLHDQQDPGSPSYHQWLTPGQYGERFGLSGADLAILQSWLQARGFRVDQVAPSRNRIVFSGTAAAVESAFGTTLQRLQSDGQAYFENTTDLQLPAALAGVVQGITGLSSYRIAASQARVKPLYTVGNSSTHYLVPWDFRQVFGTNTLLNSGYNGAGVRIAILGQSAIDTTQIANFQARIGQSVVLPTQTLVPNTGASNKVSVDEEESELDIEQASGGAPGATILFLYTGCSSATSGSCGNNGIFDALSYAITNNSAPILTLSYGGCESDLTTFANNTIEPLLKQSNTQGQTVVVSTGDSGAAACDAGNSVRSATHGLTVNYPASSIYVTAVGGTEFSEDSNTGYWATTNNSFSGSANGYIPEVAWNDTATLGSLSAGGGGVSKLFSKPPWQTGTGVPADAHRDVPDVAFPSGVTHDPYLICSGAATCGSSAGFGSNNGGLVGGTSAATPGFAAMLAVITQANGGAALGNINAKLYSLAAGSSAGSVFHDITSGSNIVPCTTGTTDCTTGSLGYNAGTGYDLATGLGSIDAPSLLAALQGKSTPTLQTPTVTLTASTTTPATNTAVSFSAKVTGSAATPTGTATFAVDGAVTGSPIALAAGVANYTYSGFTTAGQHTISVTYSGDTNYTRAVSTFTATASAPAPLTSTLALTASNTTPTTNTADTFTVKVTGSGSAAPTGTVLFSVDGISVSPTTMLAAGTAAYTYSGFTTAGQHTVSVSYSGDSNYSTRNAAIVLTAAAPATVAPAVTLIANPNPAITKSAVTFNASVIGSGTRGAPTGTLTFTIDGIFASPAITLNNGSAGYAYTGFAAAGSHSIIATYSGDTNYSRATQTLILTASKPTNLAATAALAASNTAPAVNTPVTFTAKITGSSATVPTGSVTFAVDGTAITGSLALTSGSATTSYTGFTTAGAHTVTVNYSGDTTYAKTSASISITASATAVTPGIVLTGAPTALTIASGSKGTENITVSSTGGFAGTVSLSAKILSSTGAAFAGCIPTVTASPTATSSATVAMTVFTTSSGCTSASLASMQGGEPRMAWIIASAGLVGLCVFRRRLRPAALLLIALSIFTITGCGVGGTSTTTSSGGSGGGGTASPPTTTTTTNNSYLVQVTGVDTANTVKATSTFALTIQ